MLAKLKPDEKEAVARLGHQRAKEQRKHSGLPHYSRIDMKCPNLAVVADLTVASKPTDFKSHLLDTLYNL